MATLSNSKGISSRSVIEVPAQWDPQWFRTFIRTQLSTADVRNAVPGAGIVISGNPTTNATISTNSAIQALFAQPYVLLGTPVAPAVLTGYRGLAIESSVLTLTDGGATHAITVGVASHGIGNAKLRQSGPLSVIGNALGGISDVADISASADGQLLRRAGTALGFGTVKLADTAGLGASFTTSGLTAGQVLRANGATGAAFTALAFTDLPTMPTLTVLGNATGGSATPTALSQTQLTALVNTFSTSLSGAVPASGGGTTKFLRADGTFTAPGVSPTFSGTTASTASGTPVTLQTLASAGLATYLVCCDASVNDPVNYNVLAVVNVNGTVAKVTTLQTATLMTISLSGLSVQATQTSGGALAITYSIVQIA